ncbi:unnamed protein product [Ectocarpus sp. 12 AP-2014]
MLQHQGTVGTRLRFRRQLPKKSRHIRRKRPRQKRKHAPDTYSHTHTEQQRPDKTRKGGSTRSGLDGSIVPHGKAKQLVLRIEISSTTPSLTVPFDTVGSATTGRKDEKTNGRRKTNVLAHTITVAGARI